MKKKLFVFTILVSCLLGCEQTSCIYLDIKNSSQNQLYVELYYGAEKVRQGLGLDISSGYQQSFWVDCGKGGIAFVYPATIGIDSIHFVSYGVFSKGFNESTNGKNPFLQEYWTQETIKRAGGGSYSTSTFEITSDDVEAWQGN